MDETEDRTAAAPKRVNMNRLLNTIAVVQLPEEKNAARIRANHRAKKLKSRM